MGTGFFLTNPTKKDACPLSTSNQSPTSNVVGTVGPDATDGLRIMSSSVNKEHAFLRDLCALCG